MSVSDDFNRANENPIAGNWTITAGGVFCSAYVSICLKAADKYKNWVLFKEWHPTRISPAMLWNHGKWTQLNLEETPKK